MGHRSHHCGALPSVGRAFRSRSLAVSIAIYRWGLSDSEAPHYPIHAQPIGASANNHNDSTVHRDPRYRHVHLWQRLLFHGSLCDGEPHPILGATVLPQTVLVVAVIVVVVILVGLFFGFTLTGKAMQACAFNRDIAKLMGSTIAS